MSSSGAELIGEPIDKDGFRLRGTALARIDAFSDVVFGFALTLLVVSLEVPKTFAELHGSLRQFVPFAISFMFLMLVWYAHYKFFRRFGTHDAGTIAINGILLFVVLFYVYPLKFLFTLVAFWVMRISVDSLQSYHELVELMVLYGAGFTSIYLLLAALYANGLRQKKDLSLSPVEVLLTRGYVADNLGLAAVGGLACVLARVVPEQWAGVTGWTYMLISPVLALVGRWTRRRIKRVQALPATPIGVDVA